MNTIRYLYSEEILNLNAELKCGNLRNLDMLEILRRQYARELLSRHQRLQTTQQGTRGTCIYTSHTKCSPAVYSFVRSARETS